VQFLRIFSANRQHLAVTLGLSVFPGSAPCFFPLCHHTCFLVKRPCRLRRLPGSPFFTGRVRPKAGYFPQKPPLDIRPPPPGVGAEDLLFLWLRAIGDIFFFPFLPRASSSFEARSGGGLSPGAGPFFFPPPFRAMAGIQQHAAAKGKERIAFFLPLLLFFLLQVFFFSLKGC